MCSMRFSRKASMYDKGEEQHTFMTETVAIVSEIKNIPNASHQSLNNNVAIPGVNGVRPALYQNDP